MEKVFAFERKINEETEEFTSRLNRWADLHQEIKILGYEYGFDFAGQLQTVVVKWDAK